MKNLIAKKTYTIPFVIWIIAGTLIPLASIAYYGFTSREGGFTLGNILAMFRPDHMQALGLSLLLAFISTAICLIVAFPMAMILRESRFGKQGFLIFVIILPMWMNFLLRTMAWQVLLERKGVINSIAIVLGMVYDFLPFMILPIYNTVSKIDNSLIEAAYDLGASRTTTYTKVILPLSVPGIVSGITMVFIPALTTFVISNMLGGGKINLIGNIIEQEFTINSNWYLGSGLSLVMMLFIIVSMLALQKFDKTGGANLI